MADSHANRNDWEYRAPTGFLAKAPISNAVRVGNQILISGQIGIDDEGKIVPGGMAGETRACLENIREILASYGAGMENVVQVRVYVTDFAGYGQFNDVYREFFSAPFPARATIGTSGLVLGAQIEIEAVAMLPEK